MMQRTPLHDLSRMARLVACGLALALRATSPSLAEDRPTPPALVVVATVDGDPIYAGELREMCRRIPRTDAMSRDERNRLEAHLLAQRIDERIALHYLIRHKRSVSSHEVDAAMTKIRSKGGRHHETWQDYLAEQGLSEDALRTDQQWRLSWEKYLQERITEDVLRQTFERLRADFDGTRKRVRHILLRSDSSDKRSSIEELTAQATRIRKEIRAGRVSFSEAAEKYSSSPSGKTGGDLGWITRHGEMAEPFAAAAFTLERNEISPPVVTSHGVHLIQCVESIPGDRQWNEVVDVLRRAVIQRGFRRIVEKERPRVAVEFTGRACYFHPKTRKLVVPKPH